MAAPIETIARPDVRAVLIEVAARLLGEGGTAAVTTRAVAAAAGVQVPTIYRLFGDKDGLLDAVAEHALAGYVTGKSAAPDSADAMVALRAAWDRHVAFGLANPAVFARLADPNRTGSPAAAAGHRVLAERVRRVAAEGRLRVTEREAVERIHAAGTGVVLTLTARPAGDRDPGLADGMYDAVLRSISTEAPDEPADATRTAAVALRAATSELTELTEAERALLAQWLDRIAAR